MRTLPGVMLSMLFLAPALAMAGNGSTPGLSSAQASFATSPAAAQQSQAAKVLVIENTLTVVTGVLTNLGVPYDIYVASGGDFSAIPLSGYEHVFIAFDGALITATSIQSLANYASGGGAAHLLGGTSTPTFASAVNSYLLGINTASISWVQVAGIPRFSVTNPSHYLSTGLPATYNPVNASATYYMLRITDPLAVIAARNGDAFPMLVSKSMGLGSLDVSICAPDSAFWANAVDNAWMTRVITNMLTARQQRNAVLVVDVGTNTGVGPALSGLGVPYDYQTPAGLSGPMQLSGRSHVFVSFNGNDMDDAAALSLSNFAASGGSVHLFGGSSLQDYVLTVSNHLVQGDYVNTFWTMSTGTPDVHVVDASHYLARELPTTYNFGNHSGTFYQFRVTDPLPQVAAMNGDGFKMLLSKPIGSGTFDMDIETPTSAYLTPADQAFVSTIVENMFHVGRPSITGVTDVANDQGRQVRLTWYGSPFETRSGAPAVTGYAVWRRIAGSAPAAARRGAPARVQYPPGSWDYVATLPARNEKAYNMVVSSLCDSNTAGMCSSEFFVSAITSDPTKYWDSKSRSGYSVDNLPPAPPAPLTAAYAAGATHVHWGPNAEPDLGSYKVYRGSTPGFPIGAGNLIATRPDTGYADVGAAGSYYAVTAVDVNGNESAASYVTPSATTGVDDGPVAFAMGGVWPNPSHGGLLTVSFALPASGPATLEMLDVAGRRVAVRDVGALGAGHHSVLLASPGRLAPGLYLLRLTRGAERRVARVSVIE